MADNSLLSFETHGPITVGEVKTASVLDAMNVTEFGQELSAHAQAHPGVNLLLDFGQVDYLSSAVLTELLKVHQIAEKTGGSLRLCALNGDIRNVFEITNLNKMFVIYDECEEGVRKFTRSLEIEAQDQAWEE